MREDTDSHEYTMGYSAEFQQLLNRRSARINAAHLLPHLKPGMRVLDFGCGPGTISVGLASSVAPGMLHGIDLEASQIEMARDAARAGGHHNMELQPGDVTDLPFEDAFFDAAHGHAVLNHVPDTHAALAEVKRVLKPGGILSSRELIWDSSFVEPPGEALLGGWETFANLLRANGGHPQMGKELKRLYQEAGLVDIQTSASFEIFGSDADVAFYHGFSANWFFAPATVEGAVKHGLATREQFEGWRAALDRWRENPGAIAAMAWGAATGRKPW